MPDIRSYDSIKPTDLDSAWKLARGGVVYFSHPFMRVWLVLTIGLILAPGSLAGVDGAGLSSSGLDQGYRQMYNLQFEDAHNTFGQWERSHPEDPLGPTSDAADYLFTEFDRLGILETQFFTNDGEFKRGPRKAPDPAAKQAFEKALDEGDRLADQALAHDPRDRNALFAKVLDLGLESDYLCLIEKRNLTSVRYMKSARVLADRLLAIDPAEYDAYIAIGVENYILGVCPAPVRWLLRVYGMQTDKQQGIEKLRLTAEKGHYLRPFARLLLAIAALRDHNRAQARDLLAGLAREFPANRLYARELARVQ